MENFVMPLIIPGKPQIDFFLRTTKPFHNERAVNDFFQIVLSYGPDYRPYHASEKYDRKKKLVPEFLIREFFGKNLPEEFEHGL